MLSPSVAFGAARPSSTPASRLSIAKGYRGALCALRALHTRAHGCLERPTGRAPASTRCPQARKLPRPKQTQKVQKGQAISVGASGNPRAHAGQPRSPGQGPDGAPPPSHKPAGPHGPSAHGAHHNGAHAMNPLHTLCGPLTHRGRLPLSPHQRTLAAHTLGSAHPTWFSSASAVQPLGATGRGGMPGGAHT